MSDQWLDHEESEKDTMEPSPRRSSSKESIPSPLDPVPWIQRRIKHRASIGIQAGIPDLLTSEVP